MTYRSICDHLKERLSQPLPGRAAQMTMVHRGRSMPEIAPRNAREGAVLIAILPTEREIVIPMIERSDDGGPHAGQLALPGGAREENDTFPIGTALREAEEEIGLAADDLTVLGTLSSLYIPVSNFLIVPVVACGAEREIWSSLRRDPHEVTRIIAVDPRLLERTRTDRWVSARGRRYLVPSYESDGDTIWGATAIILAEFCAILATR